MGTAHAQLGTPPKVVVELAPTEATKLLEDLAWFDNRWPGRQGRWLQLRLELQEAIAKVVTN